MMQDLLAPETLSRRGLFDPKVVSQLMANHISGYADHSTELWGVMSIELWMKNFVDVDHTLATPSLDSIALHQA